MSHREAFLRAREHGLRLITCNRDDFLSVAAKQSNPGIIILFVAGVGTLNGDIAGTAQARWRIWVDT